MKLGGKYVWQPGGEGIAAWAVLLVAVLVPRANDTYDLSGTIVYGSTLTIAIGLALSGVRHGPKVNRIISAAAVTVTMFLLGPLLYALGRLLS